MRRLERFTWLTTWLAAHGWQLTALPDTPEWREAEAFLIERNTLYRELAEQLSRAAQCGRIFPVPVPGEHVKFCVREYDHGGAHQADSGEVWLSSEAPAL